MDALRWYCPKCDELVHEAKWVLKKIDEDLRIIMEDFWSGPEGRRTCRQCGTVIERAGAIQLANGKVKAEKPKAKPGKNGRSPAVKKGAKAPGTGRR
jgi:hypothetical protein